MRQILRPRPTDLGFGTQASAGRSRRLLHRDGTFNVDRRGFGLFASLHSGGHTIILITHETDVAARAARRIALRDGRIESDERS